MASGIHKIKRQKGKILQTQFYYPVQSNNNLPKKICQRPFSVRFFRIWCMDQGSMTVEAALVVPLFLIGCLMLLSIVTITQNYMDRQLKLHKTARETAVLAAGVQGSQSDMIRLRRVYSASLTPKCPGIRTILLENHCIVHKFNGYDATNGDVTGESAIYVFLTEHGSFYHRKRSCKHLNIDILPVSGKDVGAKRNKDRKIYDTCKKCLKLTKEELKRTTVFITDYGVKYHTEINCPDLKRSLRVVLLSQAEGRAACKDCCRE